MTEPAALMFAAYVRAPLPLPALRTAVARAMAMDEAALWALDDEGAPSSACFIDVQPLDGAFAWAVNLYLRHLPAGAPTTDLQLAQRLAGILRSDVLADHGGPYGEWALACADGQTFIVHERLGEDEGFWIHEEPTTWRPLGG